MDTTRTPNSVMKKYRPIKVEHIRYQLIEVILRAKFYISVKQVWRSYRLQFVPNEAKSKS